MDSRGDTLEGSARRMTKSCVIVLTRFCTDGRSWCEHRRRARTGRKSVARSGILRDQRTHQVPRTVSPVENAQVLEHFGAEDVESSLHNIVVGSRCRDDGSVSSTGKRERQRTLESLE